MIERGGIYWHDFGRPRGSAPGGRRPVVVVQADAVNRSRIGSVVVAAVASNTALAALGGNVFLAAADSGLPKDSVVNVSSLSSVRRGDLDGPVGLVPFAVMHEIEDGLRRMLAL